MAARNLLRLHAIYLAVMSKRLCCGQVQQFLVARLLAIMLLQHEPVEVESPPPAHSQRDKQGRDPPLEGCCEHVRKRVARSPLGNPFIILGDGLATGLIEMTIRDGTRFALQLIVRYTVRISSDNFPPR